MKKLIILITAAFIIYANTSTAQNSPTQLVLTSSYDDVIVAHLDNADMRASALSELQSKLANVTYPEHLSGYGIEGVSVIEFYIDSNGTVTTYTIMNSLGSSFNKAIHRSLKGIPYTNSAEKELSSTHKINIPVRFKK